MAKSATEIVPREEVVKLGGIYPRLMELETHHDHLIVKDGETYCWQESPELKTLVDGIGFIHFSRFLQLLGCDKNSEEYREFCRHMGYTLQGYYEMLNNFWLNENAGKYQSALPKISPGLKQVVAQVVFRTKANYLHDVLYPTQDEINAILSIIYAPPPKIDPNDPLRIPRWEPFPVR